MDRHWTLRILTVVHVVRGHEGVVDGHDIDVLVAPRCSQDQPKTSRTETGRIQPHDHGLSGYIL